MDLYREHILDHYQNPRNYGELDTYDLHSQVYNEFCGDKISLQIKLHDQRKKPDKAIVDRANFTGEGCAVSLASASILTEYIQGRIVAELKVLEPADIVKLLGIDLTPVRLKCALLSWEALRMALEKI